MLYEAQAHVAAAHRALARLDATLHLLDVVGCVVGELTSAEVRPHLLHGVEFGCVGRQGLDPERVCMVGDVRTDQLAAMGGETIPDHRDRPADVPAEMDITTGGPRHLLPFASMT